MEELVRELNVEGARLARGVCDEAESKDGRPRWVAGVLGPTNRTASISPDVNDPGARNVTFAALVETYVEATEGLLDGGADPNALNKHGFAPLHLAAASKGAAAEAAIETLVRGGAAVNARDASTDIDGGRTALHHALMHGRGSHVALLCSLGADASIANGRGYTPLRKLIAALEAADNSGATFHLPRKGSVLRSPVEPTVGFSL
jgi:5-methyltetrahydrofolate--homocysteine methyltransferase